MSRKSIEVENSYYHSFQGFDKIKHAYIVSLGVIFKIVVFTNICRNYDSTLVVAHTFNHSIWRQRQEDLREFRINLVYTVSFRMARIISRKNKQTNKSTKNSQENENTSWMK